MKHLTHLLSFFALFQLTLQAKTLNKYFPCEPGNTYHYYANDSLIFKDSTHGVEYAKTHYVGYFADAFDSVQNCIKARTSPSGKSLLISTGDMYDTNNYWLNIAFKADIFYSYNLVDDFDIPTLDDTVTYSRFDNLSPYNKGVVYENHTLTKDTLSQVITFAQKNPYKNNRTTLFPNGSWESKIQYAPQLGVVAISYQSAITEPMSPPTLVSYDSLDFNPLHQDLTLRYITRGKDTLYNSETEVYTPVLSTPWSQIQGPYLQIPNPFSSAKPIQADFIDSKGSIIPASIHLDQGYLHILKPATSLQPQWIRISQGKDWRIFRLKNSIQ